MLFDMCLDKCGIGVVWCWVMVQFEVILCDCGGCIEVVMFVQVFSGEWILIFVEVMDVVVIKCGSSDFKCVIMMSGYLDLCVIDIMDIISDVLGVNDDVFGVVVLMEVVWLLSKWDNCVILVFVVLFGEEQGLYGGRVLVDYVVVQGWQVEVDFNNDIVGNSCGQNGVCDNIIVWVFSEGMCSIEMMQQVCVCNYFGGEVDLFLCNVVCYMVLIVDQYLFDFCVKLVYCIDCYGCGGDQVEFFKVGYLVICVSEGYEDYICQYQDLCIKDGVYYGDMLDGIDFCYFVCVIVFNMVMMVVMVNVLVLLIGVKMEGVLVIDIMVCWIQVFGVVGYCV